jgi:hypothetical protein
MSEYQTNSERFFSFMDRSDFGIIVGHGSHIPSVNKPYFKTITVPDDVYVIYMANPGYLSLIMDSTDEKFKNIFFNSNNIKRFLKDQLSPSEIPDIVKYRNWNWKRHVYPPGSDCPDFIIQASDPLPNLTNRSVPRHERYGFGDLRYQVKLDFDKVMGITKIPLTHSGRYGFGRRFRLNDALHFLGRNRIVFVFGCRGDNSIPRERLIAEARVGEPQTYPIEMTPLRRNLPVHEKLVSTHIETSSRKRRPNKHIGTNTRKRRTNDPNRMNLN